MLTKYALYIGDKRHEIGSEHIRNWDQITCVYSRRNLDGVVRSFTGKFEFVNEVYDLLQELYLKDGFKARAILEVLTINDNWIYEPQFEAPLDFSTISWDGLVLSIAAIDDSLGALISAHKSTKYEFEIGKDIPVADKLNYDRLTMLNTGALEIMGNGVDNQGRTLIDHTENNIKPLPTYIVGNTETYENSPVLIQDENSTEGAYFMEIVRAVNSIELEIMVNMDDPYGVHRSENTGGGRPHQGNVYTQNLEIYLAELNSDNSYTMLNSVFINSDEICYERKNNNYKGLFRSYEALLAAYPNPEPDVWAAVGTDRYSSDCKYYFTPVSDNPKWEFGETASTGTIGDGTYQRKYITKLTLANPSVRKKYALVYKSILQPTYGTVDLTSSIRVRWESRANSINIDALTPQGVIDSLMDKVADGKLAVNIHISDSDARLAKTYLLAAESIRDIPGAKLYTTFQEFCEWMEAVFGYTYQLGKRTKSKFNELREYDEFNDANAGDESYLNEVCPTSNYAICFFESSMRFFAYSYDDDALYSQWERSEYYESSEYYNDNTSGTARKWVLFKLYNGGAFYVDDDNNIQQYNGDLGKYNLDTQELYFVHRSSIFSGANEVVLKEIRELKYTINSSLIYSTVEIGYEKQDYETECGRDEWNFTNVYNTGVEVTNNTLSLISKYRADCYGLEFLAQKRANDTTDDKSDNTIFFVHCKVEEDTIEDEDTGEITTTYRLVLDRSVTIEGALSDTVFNGEYSPYYCLQANKDFIAAMCSPVRLTFASSGGNSEIVIDGIACNVDHELSNPQITAGEVSFITADVDTPVDSEALIRVKSNGVVYKGYLKEAQLRYAAVEAAKYKLIVKSIDYED